MSIRHRQGRNELEVAVELEVFLGGGEGGGSRSGTPGGPGLPFAPALAVPASTV